MEPENAISRWAANTWMLFPKDQEYRDWFAKAGFSDIQVRYVRPQCYTSRVEYGLAVGTGQGEVGPLATRGSF